MAWPTIVAIYFLIWWTVLFAVLPWGVHSQHESDEAMAEGTDPGAPLLPQLKMKVLWTTIVATIVFAIFYAIYRSGVVTIDDLAALLGFKR